MFWQQPRAPAFCDGDVNQWHDCPAQIEDSDKVGRAQRDFCDQRPVQDFFDIQNRQAKSFAPASENAVLRFWWSLFYGPKRFEQIAGIGIRRKWHQMKVFVHRPFNSLTEIMQTAAPREVARRA
jgi:hypothetical protein